MAREPESGSGTTASPAQLYRTVHSMASGVRRCEPGPMGWDGLVKRATKCRAAGRVPAARAGCIRVSDGGRFGTHVAGCLSFSFRYRLYANEFSAVNRIRITIANAAQNLIMHVPVSYSPFAAAKATGLSGATVSNSVLCTRFSQTNQWVASPIPETRQFAAWYRKILPLSTGGELRAGDSLPPAARLRYTGPQR